MTDSPILESREIERSIRANERAKVLAEVREWLDEPKPVYVKKNNGKYYKDKMKLNYVSVDELRAKFDSMKGTE